MKIRIERRNVRHAVLDLGCTVAAAAAVACLGLEGGSPVDGVEGLDILGVAGGFHQDGRVGASRLEEVLDVEVVLAFAEADLGVAGHVVALEVAVVAVVVASDVIAEVD